MKKFLCIIFTVLVLASIAVILNKCEIESFIDTDNPQSAPSVNIPEVSPIVVIDAGHGFSDPGCESDLLSAKEADLTLITAKLLKKELENKKIRVLLTHDGKKFPKCQKITNEADKYGIDYDVSRIIENNVFSAYERVIYANTLNADTPIDLFISLHINSIENNPDLSQYEIYYHKQNPFGERLYTLSNNIKLRLDNHTRISALDSNEAYTVTRYGEFPSLLLEMGYATNKNDAKKLNSDSWRKAFCETVCEEIDDWIREKN